MTCLIDDLLQSHAVHSHIYLMFATDDKSRRVLSRAEKLRVKTNHFAGRSNVGGGSVAFVYLNLHLIGDHLHDHLMQCRVSIGVNERGKIYIDGPDLLHAQRFQRFLNSISYRRAHKAENENYRDASHPNATLREQFSCHEIFFLLLVCRSRERVVPSPNPTSSS